ncbi:kinase-like domain-containing protein [Mycena floridula]|nr:kinase-like domain-containing protein [Mycena floridula]
MLSTVSPFDQDEEWNPQPARLTRAATFGSWGVTSIGRGFDWSDQQVHSTESHNQKVEAMSTPRQLFFEPKIDFDDHPVGAIPEQTSSSKLIRLITSPLPMSTITAEPDSFLPLDSNSPSTSTCSRFPIQPPVRSPSTPRPRRRSSQQRVSLIAGRVLIAPIEPPSPPPPLSPSLSRADSASSLLSLATSTRPPSPSKQSFLGERNISDFIIETEIGRGAYGLVKRAREIKTDLSGAPGPPLVIKQIIKSRILADCWKRHSKLGTIPIEIYVLSSISNASYVLPPRRPWDPSRLEPEKAQEWIPGKTVKGHPNICPLLDFFEDNHYYYLVLPSTTPETRPGETPSPSDLFDLVESYPQGLPPNYVRSYLGQIADALCFLHSHGIVHRDVKDENVVLGADGKCILIDFGSSGLVKKSGWDTFSGTLDYAGPEILRGERYYGKEQDVWAFGVVAYVLLVGECPFQTAADAQEGLESPFSSASISLDERCVEGLEKEGEEIDGGGALCDAAALVRACLQLDVAARPTFEQILASRFLSGGDGWIDFRARKTDS